MVVKILLQTKSGFGEKLKAPHAKSVNNLSIQAVARILGDRCDSAVNNSG